MASMSMRRRFAILIAVASLLALGSDTLLAQKQLPPLAAPKWGGGTLLP
jgi:hypothetical protein